jgi:hypothetical protein
MFCLCAALAAATPASAMARATGAAGDVYICHPLLVHSASTSIVGTAPRCILNIPHPFGAARLREKQGALSAVALPIVQALGTRHLLPRPLRKAALSLAVRSGQKLVQLNECDALRVRHVLIVSLLRAAACCWATICCALLRATIALAWPTCHQHYFTPEDWAATSKYVNLRGDGSHAPSMHRTGFARALAVVAHMRRRLLRVFGRRGYETGDAGLPMAMQHVVVPDDDTASVGSTSGDPLLVGS